MNIYFLRHASAGETRLNPSKDDQRPLDEEGILQTRYVGRFLAAMDVNVDQIVSSPLKRARQTASIAANELAYEREIKLEDALRPQASFADFEAMLARYKRVESLLIVGHNPNLTEFLGRLISHKKLVAELEVKKGCVAKVEMSGRSGKLVWMVPPRIARLLQPTTKRSSRPKVSRK